VKGAVNVALPTFWKSLAFIRERGGSALIKGGTREGGKKNSLGNTEHRSLRVIPFGERKKFGEKKKEMESKKWGRRHQGLPAQKREAKMPGTRPACKRGEEFLSGSQEAERKNKTIEVGNLGHSPISKWTVMRYDGKDSVLS